MKSPEKQKEDIEKMMQDARKRFCEYTENPFSTDMRNYMQRVKNESSPTGWGVIIVNAEETKKRLDSGQCWMDYPALNEDGTEIEGVTGLNFFTDLKTTIDGVHISMNNFCNGSIRKRKSDRVFQNTKK